MARKKLKKLRIEKAFDFLVSASMRNYWGNSLYHIKWRAFSVTAQKYAELQFTWHSLWELTVARRERGRRVRLLCPGEAGPPVLFSGRSWGRPLGLARLSRSLEQILFYPGLPTSYWWVYNGSCVPVLGYSAFRHGTCWIGEFLGGTEGWSFVLRHAPHFHF